MEIKPCYEKMHDWEFYGSSLDCEYTQSVDEGLDIEKYKGLFDEISRLPKGEMKKEMSDVLFKAVLAAEQRPDYKYIEPSQLEEIEKLRKPCEMPQGEIKNLEEKIHGAWLGRVCGCMLGKTVEGIRTEELVRFLKQTDNYPMKRYILKSDCEKVDLSEFKYNLARRPFADTVCAMPSDDDTNYTVLAQLIIDRYGKDFTPDNVCEAWVKYQPKDAYCTAERVAFCNFIKGYRPPYSAIYQNPYREWIGAQIRADYWGYINPGDPENAARTAWKDACISHVKNGIYGEMFVAAMLAGAALTDDMKKIIEIGLSQIPYTSRLYEEINHIIEMHEEGKTNTECFAYIHSRYCEANGYGWCHTISNAMIVAAALLYGEGDYGKSVCMAVETGFDTDCNGATVGSVVGMAKGKKCIGEQWSAPFNDILTTSIFGVDSIRISEAAKKTVEHIISK